MPSIARFLPEGPARWRLALAAVFVVLAAFSAAIGGAVGSVAARTEAIDLLVGALLLTADPVIAALEGQRKLAAGLARHGIVVGLAGWTGLDVLYRCFVPITPAPEGMATVAALVLAVNGCLFGLIGKDETDLPLRMARSRARSEVLGGVAMLLAAGVVAVTGSRAADLVVAVVGMALLIMASVPALRRDLLALSSLRTGTTGGAQ